MGYLEPLRELAHGRLSRFQQGIHDEYLRVRNFHVGHHPQAGMPEVPHYVEDEHDRLAREVVDIRVLFSRHFKYAPFALFA
jgi:hypothetical protein